MLWWAYVQDIQFKTHDNTMREHNKNNLKDEKHCSSNAVSLILGLFSHFTGSPYSNVALSVGALAFPLVPPFLFFSLERYLWSLTFHLAPSSPLLIKTCPIL